MFITVLFIIARKQKQPKCPSTDEQKKKMCYQKKEDLLHEYNEKITQS